MGVDIKVFFYVVNICITTFRPCEFEVLQHCGRQEQQGGGEYGGR